jgi:hypothetical protein
LRKGDRGKLDEEGFRIKVNKQDRGAARESEIEGQIEKET